MAKLITNDRSASMDDAAGEANVSSMAPFRRALEKIDAEIAAGNGLVDRYWDSNRQVSDIYRHQTQGLQYAKEILVEALKEATSHDETGGRSSTPSG
jgi:hypothetical protein